MEGGSHSADYYQVAQSDSSMREIAELLATRRDEEVSVVALADETGLSRSAIRRVLTALALVRRSRTASGDLYAEDVDALIVLGNDEANEENE